MAAAVGPPAPPDDAGVLSPEEGASPEEPEEPDEECLPCRQKRALILRWCLCGVLLLLLPASPPPVAASEPVSDETWGAGSSLPLPLPLPALLCVWACVWSCGVGRGAATKWESIR